MSSKLLLSRRALDKVECSTENFQQLADFLSLMFTECLNSKEKVTYRRCLEGQAEANCLDSSKTKDR